MAERPYDEDRDLMKHRKDEIEVGYWDKRKDRFNKLVKKGIDDVNRQPQQQRRVHSKDGK